MQPETSHFFHLAAILLFLVIYQARLKLLDIHLWKSIFTYFLAHSSSLGLVFVCQKWINICLYMCCLRVGNKQQEEVLGFHLLQSCWIAVCLLTRVLLAASLCMADTWCLVNFCCKPLSLLFYHLYCQQIVW